MQEGFLSLALSLCLVGSAAGQSSLLPSHPITIAGVTPDIASAGQEIVLLKKWTQDYQEWRAWYLQWRNRPEPGMFSTHARRVPPAPPAWLPSLCAGPTGDAGPVADACAALRE